MDDRTRRSLMVDTQISARGVKDPRVLTAMREVPRHLFVPAHVRHEAYADRPLPLGAGQTISQPYIVAVMTAHLAVRPGDRVLEIGTGSGYQAAILARLASQVVTIERHAPLAAHARRVFAELGITNVDVIDGDGTEGAPSQAPFDRILVTAGAPSVPDALKAQLSDEGLLVIPVGTASLQHLLTIERAADSFIERLGEPCVFVPLIGRHGWPSS